MTNTLYTLNNKERLIKPNYLLTIVTGDSNEK